MDVAFSTESTFNSRPVLQLRSQFLEYCREAPKIAEAVTLLTKLKTPHHNRLLSSLADEDYARLSPHLEAITLPYRYPLYEAYEPIEFVYFLESGVASLVNTMENGSAAEVGTIGDEGMVGIPVIFGDTQAPTSAYMQVAGTGLRMKTPLLLEAMDDRLHLRKALLRYGHAFFNQVTQSAACNTFHSLEQRCARWLLMTRERMRSDEFPLTHEFLAMMLGVRRAGVTVAASALQKAGIIRYRPGHITVLDYEALEARSCECYQVSKAEFDRLLGE